MRPFKTRRLRKIILPASIILSLFAVYSIAGFFLVPYVARPYLAESLSESLHRNVTIRHIRINPYSLSVAAEDVRVRDKDGKGLFASVREFYTNLEIESLFRGAVVLSELTIRDPYLKLIRTGENEYNASDLLQQDKKREAKKEAGLPRFSLNNIRLLNGQVDLIDRVQKVEHEIRQLDIQIPFISNLQTNVAIWVKPLLAAEVNKSYFRFDGRTRPFSPSRETTLEIDFRGLRIPNYFAYVAPQFNFRVPSGRLEGRANISFAQPPELNPVLRIDFKIGLHDLKIEDLSGRKILVLPELKLTCPSYEPLNNKMRLSSLEIRKPDLEIRRNKRGELNIAGLVAAKKAQTSVRLDRAEVWGGTVSFIDRSLEHPFRMKLDSVNIVLTGFESPEPVESALHVSARTQREGKLDVRGKVRPVLSVKEGQSKGVRIADLELDLEDLHIVPLQSYLPPSVKMRVKSGTFSAKGTALLETAGEGAALHARFRGDAAISGFSSVDGRHERKLIGWKRFRLWGIDAGTEGKMEVERAVLNGLSGRVGIDESGRINVKGIFQGAKEKEEGEKKGKTPPFRIGRIDLSDGTMVFQDRSVTPRFRASITDINGRIRGLSSGSDSQVEISAKQEKRAPIGIRGRIGPLAQEVVTLDLSLQAKSLDMTELSPYARKYIGYTIRSGDLNAQLKYSVSEKNMQGRNHLVLKQFELGPKVQDVTALPVPFLVSVLRGPGGKIELTIPVEGKLDDPEFDLGGVIRRHIGSFFATIASSPFRFLGSVLGIGGKKAESLSRVEFDYGSSRITSGAAQKLNRVVQILGKRPGLRVGISGFVDRREDAEEIKRMYLVQALAELRAESGRGDTGAIGDNPADYGPLLRELARRRFPSAEATTMTPQSLQNYLLSLIPVGESDLQELARARSKSVQTYLIDSGKLDPVRTTLIRADSLEPPENGNLQKSRAVLHLK